MKCTCTLIVNKGTKQPDGRVADPDCPTHLPAPSITVHDLRRQFAAARAADDGSTARRHAVRKLDTIDRVIADLQAKRDQLAARAGV